MTSVARCILVDLTRMEDRPGLGKKKKFFDPPTEASSVDIGTLRGMAGL